MRRNFIMSMKKKLGLGIATAALGISLVGGGTFAYFSDSEVTNNTFAAGTLDLSVDPTEIIEVSDIKPGDKMNRSFTLINDGSLDISKVLLGTAYTVTDVDGDNVEDFGEHIRVNFFYNEDKTTFDQFDSNDIVESKTLKQLKDLQPDTVDNDLLWWLFDEEQGGLKVGDSDQLHVQFEFVDNDADQNEFQGDSLNLEWTFNAEQTRGEFK